MAEERSKDAETTDPPRRGRKKGFRHSEETKQKMRKSHGNFFRDPVIPVPSQPEVPPGAKPREGLVDDLRRIGNLAAEMAGAFVHEPTSLAAWRTWVEHVIEETETHLSRLRRTKAPRKNKTPNEPA